MTDTLEAVTKEVEAVEVARVRIGTEGILSVLLGHADGRNIHLSRQARAEKMTELREVYARHGDYWLQGARLLQVTLDHFAKGVPSKADQ